MNKKPTETPETHQPIPQPQPAATPASAVQPIIDDLKNLAATQPPSIVQPIIDDLKGRLHTQLPTDNETAPVRGPVHPPQPAELDQNPGGGYNADHTYPQT